MILIDRTQSLLFVTCTLQGNHQEEEPQSHQYMYDEPHSRRFPNDECCYTVYNGEFRPSWTDNRYSHKWKNKEQGINVTYFSCLGRYECPEPGCNFAANSARPQAVSGRSRCKWQLPLKPMGQTTCVLHGHQLVHTGPCPAYWTCESQPPTEKNPNGHTVVNHHGKHNHREPPNEPISNKALQKIEGIVQHHMHVTPSVLKQGVAGEEPVHSYHPGLCNVDRLKYLRNKALGKSDSRKSTASIDVLKLEEIPTIEKDLGYQIFPEDPNLGRGQYTS